MLGAGLLGGNLGSSEQLYGSEIKINRSEYTNTNSERGSEHMNRPHAGSERSANPNNVYGGNSEVDF